MIKTRKLLHVGKYMYGGGAERLLVPLAQSLPLFDWELCGSLVEKMQSESLPFIKTLPFPVVEFSDPAADVMMSNSDAIIFWGPIDLPLKLVLRKNLGKIFIAHSPYAVGSYQRNHAVTDFVVAVSRQIDALLAPDMPHRTIYPTLDMNHLRSFETRSETRQRLGFSDSDFVLGFVGSLLPCKNPELIVDAIALMPEVKGLFVGSGELAEALQGRVDRAAPGRVVFRSTDDEIGDLYQVMDAVCLPSEAEGFPLVAIESLQCGVPLIVAKVGDLPELLRDGESALFIDPRDPVASIVSAVTLLQIKETRIRIASQGKLFAEPFLDNGRYVLELVECFESAMREAAQRSFLSYCMRVAVYFFKTRYEIFIAFGRRCYSSVKKVSCL